MLKNYFTVALRSLLRNKSYTFINITGLTLGIATCLIIFLIIRRETSYDSFHADREQIYRIVRETKSPAGLEKSNATPYPLSTAMNVDFTDLASITEFHYDDKVLASVGDDKMYVDQVIFADSSFFDVFGFEVLSGNPKKELAQPGKVFITEEFAAKLKDKNIRRIRVKNQLDLEIVGVIKTPPSASHINFSMIISRPSLTEDFTQYPLNSWTLTASGFTYVKLRLNQSAASIQDRFPKFLEKHFSKEDAAQQRYLLQPIAAIHYNTESPDNPGTTATSSSTLYVLGFIGLFILVIACVNFINLTTALSFKKSKEAGVRKTLGAEQKQLVFQFLSETFLITIISAVFAVGITEWAAPFAGKFLNAEIQLNFFSNGPVVVFLVIVVFATSVLSGLYPSVVLSRFSPVRALKNKVSAPAGASNILRKSLVVLQFFIAQVLIICTLVVAGQINFFRNSTMGFAKESVINIPLPDNKEELVQSLRTRLLSNTDITGVTMSLGAPVTDNTVTTFAYLTDKGPEERRDINLKAVDENYQKVYGLQLLEGRWFLESEIRQASQGEMKDRHYAYVITESAAKAMGYSDPKDILGKNLKSGLYDAEGPVVGIVKNFNSSSLKSKMEPVVFVPFPSFYYDAGIKISGNNVPATLKFIEQTWQERYPEYLFQYDFLDEFIGKLYTDEEKIFSLFQIFAGIAILIGCLGLYGLASYMANQRTKEVAIRKTLGASVTQIVGLFSKEFIVLVIVAFMIAAPVSYYAMNQWLQTFAYQNGIGWTVFASGILFTTIIAFATVGYRSLRAAISNPVTALRSE